MAAFHPLAGIDYPNNWIQFQDWFPNSDACLAYLTRLRWPDGFACPYCGGMEGRQRSNGFVRCTYCRHDTSITSGTTLEGTRKSMLEWFTAAWFVTHRKDGGSALALQRDAGFKSYQTAWAWLHKLRRAMVRPGRDLLKGPVEIDETYVGGSEHGVRGRETRTKSIVVIAAEERSGGRCGRIRMGVVPNLSAPTLTEFVKEAVEPGAVIHTDGFLGYQGEFGLRAAGYDHIITNLSNSTDPAHILMPRVHHVASLAKRWLLGTHQGAVRPYHLAYYLDEYTFRYNRRTSNQRGLLFYRLLQQALLVDHVPYKQLLNPNRLKKPRQKRTKVAP